MDFLRSLASSSLASLAGGGIPNLPQYTLGEKQPVWDTNCIWQLFNGVRKDDQLPVSIFHFDANTSPSGRSFLPLAKNHLRKLRSIRYPDVLKFLDASETDHQVWVITERVVPLNMKLGEPDVATEEWKIWGLARIVSALQFINKEVGATHGNLRASSIFVSQGGEWKLSGFEVLSSPKDQNPVLYTLGGALPGAGALASPEVAKQGWSMIREQDPSALDSFQLYIFIYQIFNNSLPPSGAPQPGSIPRSLFGTIRKLGNPSPAGRMKTVDLWEAGMAEAGFFKTNRLVRICNGLEGMALMGESERGALIKMIKESPTPLPPDFLTHKVLPSLLNVFEFSPGGPALLPLILSFSTNLPSAAYAQTVLPIVLRMFSSPDRAMRVALLENIDSYKEHLDTRMVCDKIWPNLVGGFSDTVAIVREMTVRSIPSFAPKLSERILNNDLLRHLAKSQTDPDPSIRTNTAILLGRLSKQLTISTQRKVLVPAFARAVRDPFPPSRTAGLAALMATVEIYERDDLAAKVIPAMSLCLVDKEKKVRDQAFKAMDMFVKRLEVLVRDMPETVQNDAQSAPSQIYTTPPTAAATNTTVSPALTTSAAAASYLGSWAMSTISKQLELGSTMSPTPATQPPVPQPVNGARPMNGTVPSRPQALTPRPPSLEAPAPQIEEWGGDPEDLMDVTADQGDWTEFETAPQHKPKIAAIRQKGPPASRRPVEPKKTPMKLDAKKLDMSTFAPEPDDDIGDAFGGDAGWDLDAVADENWGMNEPAPEPEVRSVSPGRVASPPVKPASPAPLTASSSTKSPATSPPITISKAGKGLSAVHGPGRAKQVNSTPSRRVSVSTSKDKTNDGWGSFDDEQEEKEPEKVTSVASGVDKKAEMERMRLERKKRLEEAKKAKEAARNK